MHSLYIRKLQDVLQPPVGPRNLIRIFMVPGFFFYEEVAHLGFAERCRFALIRCSSTSILHWCCISQRDIHVAIGLASDDVTKHSKAWQRRKLVLNKDSAPYKSMLGEKSLTGRSSLFLRGEV